MRPTAQTAIASNEHSMLAIASGWKIPNDPKWCAKGRKRFFEYAGLSFRTAAHEIGHTLNLKHPSSSSVEKLMSVTDALVDAKGFPDSIPIGMSDEEKAWICHQPDPMVRPGGIPFPVDEEALIRALKSAEASLKPCTRKSRLVLKIKPLFPSFPFGAPIRLSFELQNRGRSDAVVPIRLGFS